MKGRQLVCALAAIVAAAAAGAGGAAGSSVTATFLADPVGTCQAGPTTGTPTASHATVRSSTDNDSVVADIWLRGVAPSTVYAINVVQTPSGENCFTEEFHVTTNRYGNVYAHLVERKLPGQTGAFVEAFPAFFASPLLATPNVPIVPAP